MGWIHPYSATQKGMDMDADHLTEEELGMLLDALDCWERQPVQDGMMSGMLTAMLTKDKAQAEREIDAAKEDAARKMSLRKRRVILLKARLVNLADERAVDTLFHRDVAITP
jgi:hypothetical protein